MKSTFYILTAILFLFTGCNNQSNQLMSTNKDSIASNPSELNKDTGLINRSDEEWSKLLPREVYEIARQKGTERAFSGKYNSHKEVGTYYCAACGNPLFNSNGKFESSCGWPSFFEPISKGSIIYAPDNAHGMKRTEVMCGRCKSHLGHVFEDGPPPTGLRYCINSVILNFEDAKEAEKKFTK
ncbi:MAG: peptide-methionine (R)-S-oxide reductase MsrB [Ferruginibacter sp.]